MASLQPLAKKKEEEKSITANAIAYALAVCGKGEKRLFCFFNGCQWRRGFTTLNKQLFRGNSLSFNELTGYLLIFNMLYIKQYFWIELFLKFTMKKMLFYKRSHRLFATGGIQFTALLIHSYGIRKRRLSVVQLWLKLNDVKAVMWLVIKAHVIQVSRYTFFNSNYSKYYSDDEIHVTCTVHCPLSMREKWSIL